MKACVYAGNTRVELRDVPFEDLKTGEVRVKVAYCAICATDAHVVDDGLFGLPTGIVMGHEVSGVISELGPGTELSGFKVGDRIIGSPLRNCGQCEMCRSGRQMYCTSYQDFVFGGMAEYKVYNMKNVYKIPDKLSIRDACLVEPLTCVMRAMEHANIHQGDKVCLSGLGGIGLLMLQAIKMRGASRVTVIEPVASKREIAKKLGAEYEIDPMTENTYERAMEITDGMGFDIVVECSGARSAAPVCIDIAGKCGKVVYFAVYPEDFELPVNLFKLYGKELSLHTVYNHTELFPKGVEFATELDLNSVIGAEFPLDQCEEAFAAFRTKKYPKVIVKCSQDV